MPASLVVEEKGVEKREMVEVRVEIIGPGVCMPGEKLVASVTFTNEAPAAATVGWAGAQIHCQLVCREDAVRADFGSLVVPVSPAAATDTAFIPNRGLTAGLGCGS